LKNETNMTNIIRVERSVVNFGGNLEVDGYKTPSGEFRVGIAGASKVLGFAENWLSRTITKNSGTTHKLLNGLGFKPLPVSGTIKRNGTGDVSVQTISLKDFALLIIYGAIKNKPQAIALQISLTKMSLTDFFRDSFKETPLTIEEKRALFYSDYAQTINWSEEDFDDWKLIDEQELFLLS